MPTLCIRLRTIPLAAHGQFLSLRLGTQVHSSFGADATPNDLCLLVPLTPDQPAHSLFGAWVSDNHRDPSQPDSAGVVVNATFELLPDPPAPARLAHQE